MLLCFSEQLKLLSNIFNLKRSPLLKISIEIIDKLNKNLPAIEKIKNFSILKKPFSLENNMLTPTLKMKRYVIKKNFIDLLNSFYK